ncbi:hypothetical protein BDZ97DRAFT_2031093 [Flammula alnicola]|nr:hypothetical protein BDZ97DRAFT_2031093 [Flammula alnicola]
MASLLAFLLVHASSWLPVAALLTFSFVPQVLSFGRDDVVKRWDRMDFDMDIQFIAYDELTKKAVDSFTCLSYIDITYPPPGGHPIHWNEKCRTVRRTVRGPSGGRLPILGGKT